MEINNNTKFLLGLHSFYKFGPSRIKRIKNYFSSYEEGFKASSHELIKAQIEEKIAYEFIEARQNINLEKILEKIEEEKIKIIILDEKNYPKLLKEIYNPPFLLYYKGRLPDNNDFNLSVVGARKFTPYGKQVVSEITRGLVNNKINIISGLALGIDTLAHQSTLLAKGKTFAVLGTGIDNKSIYPPSNYYLAQKIIESDGALISELPLYSLPLRHHFPQRNRIISGLSLGTLVIEASIKSGALITARFALEQNREVFAVPGSIFNPTSEGPLNLIKQGAAPVRNAEEILEILDLKEINKYIDNKKIIADSSEEKIILKFLSKEAVHINNLVRLSTLDISLVSSTLILMEMKGIVKNLGGMEYVLAR
jgi:DNA processing protein